MKVAKFLGELALAPDVEVVITRLLGRFRSMQRQFARNRLLQRLQGLWQPSLFRFAYQ
jgi:hypothetical protein